MPTFVPYYQEVETTPHTGTSSWVTIDLAPWLADPTAKAVVLRFSRSTGGVTWQFGVRDVNDPNHHAIRVLAARYFTACVGLAGGTSIQVYCQTGWSVRIWITGEVHDDAVIYSQGLYHDGIGEGSVYVDRQPTPQGADSLSDIGAVIVRVYMIPSGASEFVVREKDSAFPPKLNSDWCGMSWWVVGLNEDGYYTTYAEDDGGGDTIAQFIEVGYILKTSGVVTVLDPTEEDPIENGAGWDPLDLSAITQPIDAGATVVGLGWYDPSHNGALFIKAVGSPIPPARVVNADTWGTQIAQVNELRQVDYQVRSDMARFWVFWWEGPPPATRFLFDVDVRPALAAGSDSMLPIEAASDVRTPVEAAPADTRTPLDAAVDVETPFDVEAETGPEES